MRFTPCVYTNRLTSNARLDLCVFHCSLCRKRLPAPHHTKTMQKSCQAREPDWNERDSSKACIPDSQTPSPPRELYHSRCISDYTCHDAHYPFSTLPPGAKKTSACYISFTPTGNGQFSASECRRLLLTGVSDVIVAKFHTDQIVTPK